jgi:hypothetical protein
VLIGTVVLSRALGVPAIALGGGITVVAWHGFALGREMRGWNPYDNIGTLFMIGFFAFVLSVVWAMMRRDERKGTVPVVPPVYLLILLSCLALGFVAGLVSKAVMT